MHMTKHVYGVYSTEPGPTAPVPPGAVARAADGRDPRHVRGPGRRWRRTPSCTGATAAPEWGVAVCDVPRRRAARTRRCSDAELLRSAEEEELVAAVTVTLATTNANVQHGGRMMDVAIEFDPLSADFFDDPYDTYRRLRDEAPVYYSERTGSGRCPATTTSSSRTATGRRSRARRASRSTSSRRRTSARWRRARSSSWTRPTTSGCARW